MEDQIAAVEAEITRMQQTIEVVRTLNPIKRQQDQCLDLLRGHVSNMGEILAGASSVEAAPPGGTGDGSALPPVPGTAAEG